MGRRYQLGQPRDIRRNPPRLVVCEHVGLPGLVLVLAEIGVGDVCPVASTTTNACSSSRTNLFARAAHEDSSTVRSIDRHSAKRSSASSVPQWASISRRSRIATSTAVRRSIARSASASPRRSRSQMISALNAASSESAAGCDGPLNQRLAGVFIGSVQLTRHRECRTPSSRILPRVIGGSGGEA